MYSPQCPGYADALAQMLAEQALLASAATETTTDPVASTTTSTVASTPGTTEDPTKDQAAVTTDVGGVELSTTGEIVVADGVPATAKDSARETAKADEQKAQEQQTASAQTSEKKTMSRDQLLGFAQSAARAAEQTALQTAAEAVAQSQSDAANPRDGTGLTIDLGGITLQELRAATEPSTEQAVTTVSAATRSDQTLQESRSRSESLVSVQSSESAIPKDTNIITETINVVSQESQATNVNVAETLSVQTTETKIDTAQSMPEISTSDQGITVTAIDYSLITATTNLPRISIEDQQVDIPETAALGTELDNVVGEAMQLPEITETPAPKGPSVRRGGSVDGMSGGDINSLASAPTDFNDYLGKQLQDAQFYASKEIYRGQRNVDNARALRGLGTDRLHQQMIDQQYNITEQ